MMSSFLRQSATRCRGLLAVLSVGLSACSADRINGPNAATGGDVTLNVTGPTTLTSLDDTIVVIPRAPTRDGVARDLSGLALQLSVPGILEPIGNGQFRAIGNGQVVIRTGVDTTTHGVVPSGYFVGGASDSVVVTVQQVAVSLSLLAAPDSTFGTVGETRLVGVRLADARGHAVISGAPPVTFTTADSTVVRVDASGLLHSVRDGSTAVTARSGSLSAGRTFVVRATRQHTSCMTYRRRRTAQRSCASVDFVMRHPAPVTP